MFSPALNPIQLQPQRPIPPWAMLPPWPQFDFGNEGMGWSTPPPRMPDPYPPYPPDRGNQIDTAPWGPRSGGGWDAATGSPDWGAPDWGAESPMPPPVGPPAWQMRGGRTPKNPYRNK